MGLTSSLLVLVLQVILIFCSQVFGFSLSPLSSLSSSPSFVVPQCHPDESSALLRFKSSFLIASSSPYCAVSNPDDSSFGIKSWNESTNCCEWDGITCDSVTRHVIGVFLFCSFLHGPMSSNSSLFFLRHLRTLLLSGNDFKGSPIAPEFGLFKNLTYLDLSASNFSGHIPLEISHLSKLVVLRINPSKEYKLTIHATTFRALSRNLTNLEELDFSGIDMSFVPLVSLMNLSSSLMSITLRSCQLHGELPEKFFRFPDLETLDLSGNSLSGGLPWSSLNFEKIQGLDLSHNYFIGQIPELYTNSTKTISSHLSSKHPPNLTSLDLSHNLINGTIPSWIYTLPYLKSLDLSNNLFTGEIPEFQSTLLDSLSLSHNKLHGIIPRSMFQNAELGMVDLSSNNLIGNMELEKISKTQNLYSLDLSFNNLSLSFDNSINYSFDSLSYLYLSSCNITEFLHFLRSSKRLQLLDLSQNRIQGSVPKSLWEVGKDLLFYLDLSHNQLTHMDSLPWNNLGYLNLGSNSLFGPIPVPLAPYLRVYQVSKNKHTGEIPTSFCSMTYLEVLDLSYNNLSGEIPSCSGNFGNKLAVLDLQMNMLKGTIPLAFSAGNSLRTLNLNGNQLEGSLPRSLLYCDKLQVLDVGNNKINGPFPDWLESLQELQVLILRSNQYYGPIRDSKVSSPFRKLRIIDISTNEFSGPLPSKYFENFEGMIDAHSDDLEYVGEHYYFEGLLNYYQDSVKIVLKGSDLQLEKILTVLTTIDFSRNKFAGSIPSLIGNLNSLKGLNFSHNKLTGEIPELLGNLSNLEWLDLSSNTLVGKIPLQLASDLSQLQILNLSDNKLEGPIPRGPQFDTFTEESYRGNSQLCGFPLHWLCGENIVPGDESSDEEHDNGTMLDWKVVMMGYGSGLVIGISTGYMVFISRSFTVWLGKWSGQGRHGKANARSRGKRRLN